MAQRFGFHAICRPTDRDIHIRIYIVYAKKKIRRYFNLVETKVKAFNMHNAHAFLPSSNLMSMCVWPKCDAHFNEITNLKAFPAPRDSHSQTAKMAELAAIGNHIFGVNLSSIIKRNGFLSFQSPIVMIDTELEDCGCR